MLDDCYYFFFFNDTATTEIYTLSLHDALPIWKINPQLHIVARASSDESAAKLEMAGADRALSPYAVGGRRLASLADRKSTRLNSSHANISYAVFCLKKKKKQNNSNSFTLQPAQ